MIAFWNMDPSFWGFRLVGSALVILLLSACTAAGPHDEPIGAAAAPSNSTCDAHEDVRSTLEVNPEAARQGQRKTTAALQRLVTAAGNDPAAKDAGADVVAAEALDAWTELLAVDDGEKVALIQRTAKHLDRVGEYCS